MKIVEVLTKQELLQAISNAEDSAEATRIVCKGTQLIYYIPGAMRRDVSSIGYVKLNRVKGGRSVHWSRYRAELIKNIKRNINATESK